MELSKKFASGSLSGMGLKPPISVAANLLPGSLPGSSDGVDGKYSPTVLGLFQAVPDLVSFCR